MPRVGKQDGRNFGYGRQLSHAGPQALRELFGAGRYATVKTHAERWQMFVQWCRSPAGPDINDARLIDRPLLDNYAQYLREQVGLGNLSIATAQNRLSTVNRTLEALRGDRRVRVSSPSQALDLYRNSVRQAAPPGQQRNQVEGLVDALSQQRLDRV